MLSIRSYKPADYSNLVVLYKQGDLYGGQFDNNRDSEERVTVKINTDPEAILICVDNKEIIGTVSLIEDGRVAWLFRFAVISDDRTSEAIKLLYDKAVAVLKSRGHNQVLVYSPLGNTNLNKRYEQELGFVKGNDFTCFWKDI